MLYFFSENEYVTRDVLAMHGIFPDKLIYDFEDLERLVPFLTTDDLCIVLINGFTRVIPVRLIRLFSDVGLIVENSARVIKEVTEKFVKRDNLNEIPKGVKVLLLTDVPLKGLNAMQLVYANNPFQCELTIYEGKNFVDKSKILNYLKNTQSYLYNYFFGDKSIEEVLNTYDDLKVITNALCKQYFENNGVLVESNLVVEHNNSKTKHNLEHIENKKMKKKWFSVKKTDEPIKEDFISLNIAFSYLYMLNNMRNGKGVDMSCTFEPVLHIQDKSADEKIAYIKEITLF